MAMIVVGSGLPVIGSAQEMDANSQPGPEAVIPEGTVLSITLTTFLNTRSSHVGDTFYAETAYPVWVNQQLVIPRDSLIRGTVTEVVRPGKVKGRGRLALRVDSVQLSNGVSRNLIASLQSIHSPGVEKLDATREIVETDSSKGTDAGILAVTSGQGAMIGAIADGGQGTAIGAGAGAAVGIATVLLSRGPDLVLEPGTQFDLRLKQPVRFAYGEISFNSGQIDTPRRNPPRPAYQRRDRQAPYQRGWPVVFPWIISPWI
jgi:type IV secretion system protein VirB10